MAKLREILLVMDRLDRILGTRFEFLCAVARKRGVPADEASSVVQDASIAVYNLEPRDEVASLVATWTDTPKKAERLDSALTALLVTYVRFRAGDELRRIKRRSRFVSGNEATRPSEADAIIARLTLESLDRIARRLRKDKRLTEDEWSYWRWRRKNPDATDQAFRPNATASQIYRIKTSLFAKLIAATDEPPDN